jgi:hypothetical protein
MRSLEPMNANPSGPLRHSVISFWLAVFSLALPFAGCSSSEPLACDGDDDCSATERCAGGQCKRRGCAACPDGARCVADECRDECTRVDDCEADEVCAVWRFENAGEASVCSTLEGRYTACGSDDECDQQAGFSCVEGSCRVACRSHDECSSVGHCAPLAGGMYCVAGAPTVRGQHGARCASGSSDCDTEGGFICLGAGPGDLDSYCTSDCSGDSDCPAGFLCGTQRTAPCTRACDLPGDPNRPDCAPVAEIGPGLRYECGNLAVIRRVCERRSFCSPCERDEDCLSVPGQICARDESGERICTVPCDPNANSCPWGNAARCGQFDAERGIPTCSHRFGSCRGTGKGCEPCLRDSDCGEGICSTFGFTGERFCIDLDAACDCAGDADRNGVCLGHGCPTTPGGLDMVCLQSRVVGDPLGERCISASSVVSGTLGTSQQAGCWPPI